MKVEKCAESRSGVVGFYDFFKPFFKDSMCSAMFFGPYPFLARVRITISPDPWRKEDEETRVHIAYGGRVVLHLLSMGASKDVRALP